MPTTTTTITTRPVDRTPMTGWPVTTMCIGLALTVVAAAAPLVDQATGDGLGQHLRDIYAGHVAWDDGTTSWIVDYLLTVGALGALAWRTMIWAVKRGKRWAPAVATVLFAVGAGIAAFKVVVAEYGSRLLPNLFGLLGLLPSIAGLVAVILLWAGRLRTA